MLVRVKFAFSITVLCFRRYGALVRIAAKQLSDLGALYLTSHLNLVLEPTLICMGHSVSNHPKKMKFETVPHQILMKIYTFDLYGQKRRFAK